MRAVINVGLLSDASLTAIKGAAGLFSGSAALLSDAVHSAADMLISAVTLVATRIAAQQPDLDHPYGHGRSDSLGALAVSTLLTGAGVGIGIRAFDEVSAMLQGLPVQPMLATVSHVSADALSDPTTAAVAVAACVASVGIKEVVYRWTMKVGMELRSQALIANAWHHRADSLSSLVAIVGVGGAFMGVPILDPLAAIAVAAMISKAGVEIGYRSVQELMDERLDHDVIALATETARKTRDVLAVRRVRARRMGPSVLLDLEVGLDPHVSVAEAHAVADEIRGSVFQQRPDVSECLVTVVPGNLLEHESAEHDHAHAHTQLDADSSAATSARHAGTPVATATARAIPVPQLIQGRLKQQLLSQSGAKALATFSCIPQGPIAESVHGVHVKSRIVLDMATSLRDASMIVSRVRSGILGASFDDPTSADKTTRGHSWKVVAADIDLELNPL